MSSVRRVVSEPLLARPMGLRDVATMTASGMEISVLEKYSPPSSKHFGTH
jgi:hypothetical protein